VKHVNIGTVSHATMREEDLIPTFLYEIEERMASDNYFESDDAPEDLNALFGALGEYAPEFFYFGAHPGDGSDYGYWLSEEWSERLEEDGGIRVGDTAEIPADHVGFVAVVSDHGNVTLYRRGCNHRLYEIWGVV